MRTRPPLGLMTELWHVRSWEVSDFAWRYTWRGFGSHIEISPIQNSATKDIHIYVSVYVFGLFVGWLIQGKRREK